MVLAADVILPVILVLIADLPLLHFQCCFVGLRLGAPAPAAFLALTGLPL